MSKYLERYLHGEHEQVWLELLTEGTAVQQEPLLSDALAVTQETMRRVRYNIELLVSRLKKLGFNFGVYPNNQQKIYGYTGSYHPPVSEIAKKIDYYNSLSGINSIPLSLRSFWEIVGDVNFIGYHPLWPYYSDPLVIYPIDTIKYEFNEWRERVDEGDEDAGAFLIPLAPDIYHKDNVSGGGPYGIRVPNWTIDGILENEKHNTTFVNYLRICFRYGGFPGLHWFSGSIPDVILALADELVPI